MRRVGHPTALARLLYRNVASSVPQSFFGHGKWHFAVCIRHWEFPCANSSAHAITRTFPFILGHSDADPDTDSFTDSYAGGPKLTSVGFDHGL